MWSLWAGVIVPAFAGPVSSNTPPHRARQAFAKSASQRAAHNMFLRHPDWPVKIWECAILVILVACVGTKHALILVWVLASIHAGPQARPLRACPTNMWPHRKASRERIMKSMDIGWEGAQPQHVIEMCHKRPQLMKSQRGWQEADGQPRKGLW